ncbi:hypothetical protein GQ53DRAFT_813473 [Thozetella sp. PMI_491]|nr:hypothetical protein GQ53DRAFT_813473 [Thozetella sp. PMI_491]
MARERLAWLANILERGAVLRPDTDKRKDIFRGTQIISTNRRLTFYEASLVDECDLNYHKNRLACFPNERFGHRTQSLMQEHFGSGISSPPHVESLCVDAPLCSRQSGTSPPPAGPFNRSSLPRGGAEPTESTGDYPSPAARQALLPTAHYHGYEKVTGDLFLDRLDEAHSLLDEGQSRGVCDYREQVLDRTGYFSASSRQAPYSLRPIGSCSDKAQSN